MKNLNKTIYKFDYLGDHFEIDWLTDATYNKGEKFCDIFKGKGKNAVCVGQIMIKDTYGKRIIKKLAIEEILTIEEILNEDNL